MSRKLTHMTVPKAYTAYRTDLFPLWAIRALKRTQQAILAEPERYDQNTFGHGSRRKITCASPACIAGWFYVFTPVKHRAAGTTISEAIVDTLDKALGAEVAQKIYGMYGRLWGNPFYEQYQTATTPMSKALVAASRIEHLLTTGE